MTEIFDGHDHVGILYEGVPGQRRMIIETRKDGAVVSCVSMNSKAAVAVAEEILYEMASR